MTIARSLHPTDEILRAYDRRELDEDESGRVHDHLEGCADCQRRLEDLTSASVPGARAAAGARPGHSGPIMSSTDGLSLLAARTGGSPAPPPPNSLPPGLADHPAYEITRELGRGGMGVVYLARNKLMGRLEVLKVVGGHLIDRPGVFDRFHAEIRNAARLHHPNIVTAYSAIPLGDSLVLAMEYIDGLDLTRMVQARGPLPIAQACNYVQQTALGLQHAHEHGMVHRDIKPSNLMLTGLGGRALIKVLDFGLAKVQSEGAADIGLTHEGQLLGTPAYIAPEQISNARRADIRADIYSLGCTLYYLLTGGPPFQGACLYDVLQAHQSMEAMPLNLKRPDVPVELAALAAKMMAKEPERRFQQPKEVAQALVPFFKKGELALKAPQVELSGTGRAAPDQPPPAAVSTPEPPTTDDVGPISLPSRIARSASDPAWELLIDRREADRIQDESPAKPPRRRLRWLWPSAVATLLLLAVLVAWASVIRIKTADGIIELVGLPPGTQVFVDDKGVNVTWPTGGKPAFISVAPGRHWLVLKKDGVEISSREMTVHEGGKAVFTVRLVAPVPSPLAKDQVEVRPDRSEMDEEELAEVAEAEPAQSVGGPGGADDAVPPSPPEPAEKAEATPAPNPPIPPGKSPFPQTRLVFVNEFNDLRERHPENPGPPPDAKIGRRNGVFFVATGGLLVQNQHRILADATCEVVGRVSSDDPRRRGAWCAMVLTQSPDRDFRGFLVKITVDGELFLEPNPWKPAAPFRQIDPRLGPIRHRAIRPGNQFNKILLVMRDHEVVILVNDVQVCPPVRFAYKITPALLQLGAIGRGMKRAEFDRYEIREFIRSADPHPNTEASRPAGPPAGNPVAPRTTPPARPTETTVNSIDMKLVLIPAGEFMMGSPNSDRDAFDMEKPQHRVRITRRFYMSACEVTQGQYAAVTGTHPSHFKGSNDLPVENVSWNDAMAFCDRLSEREGLKVFDRSPGAKPSTQDGYRLPTEAEWEYACRAGQTTRYQFGDDAANLGEYAWNVGNSESRTHPVGRKRPNAFGLYDMTGNVWEWCLDNYDADHYRKLGPLTLDPRGPSAAEGRLSQTSVKRDGIHYSIVQHNAAAGIGRVRRGGGWESPSRSCRSAYRIRQVPEHNANFLGFRVVRVPAGS